jgi:single-stranded DNA-specific DHH superfamily exonuclease
MTRAPVGAAAAVRRFDVCNGDADGLCSVLQWRLHEPADATLVTGLKREIALLERVPAAAADEVLVCDLSLERNRAALLRLLDAGVRVRYFDHHASTPIPQHGNFESHIDLSSEVCTSVLMDRHLGGRFRAWAAVGAYGDNLTDVADELAQRVGLQAEQRAALRQLGVAINYNAYGEQASDVCIEPARLYALMARHPDPLQMLAREPVVGEVDRLRRLDLQQAQAFAPHWCSDQARVLVLPDAPWSRRVIGCLANELASTHPRQAQAVLKIGPSGDYVVSVRAPRSTPHGAGDLCARFGGAGRAAAAGIDRLPARDLERFIRDFGSTRWGRAQ